MTVRLAHQPLLRDAISVREAAAAMGDDPATVRRLLKAGLLEGYESGQGTKRPRLRIYVDSIAEYRRRRAIGAANDDTPPRRREPVDPGPAHREALAFLKARGLL